MKPNTSALRTTVDRLATDDEILAAVLSDPIEQCSEEILGEIASDAGGYVRIPTADIETFLMVEELALEQEPWLN